MVCVGMEVCASDDGDVCTVCVVCWCGAVCLLVVVTWGIVVSAVCVSCVVCEGTLLLGVFGGGVRVDVVVYAVCVGNVWVYCIVVAVLAGGGWRMVVYAVCG